MSKEDRRNRDVEQNRTRAGHSRGFTLIELIAVVAILGILAGLFIPAAGESKKSLDITELDAMAREIYVAAQNKALSMTLLGTFEAFTQDAAVVKDFPSASQPLDWPAAAGAFEQADYRFCAHEGDMDALLAILPAGSIESTVLNGYYVIEFNVHTGDIYGVFYAQHAIDYAGDYAAADGLRKNKDERKAVMTGYYGGGAGSGIEANRTQAPTFALVNAEELYAHIELAENTDYTLTLRDAEDEHAAPFVFTFSTEKPLNKKPIASVTGTQKGTSNTLTLPVQQPSDCAYARIVLDSLGAYSVGGDTTPAHFCRLFANGESCYITPGHDLLLSVTACKQDEGAKRYLPSDALYARENSLFAFVEKEGYTDASMKKYDLAGVGYGRHLQNLDAGLSGFAPENKFAARQTAPIDWSRKWGLPTVKVDFIAAANDKLLRFEGQNNAITNLSIAANEAGTEAGLFATLSAEAVGVRLVNPSIADCNAAHIGVLAGRASGAAIKDCLVYYDRSQTRYTDEKPDKGEQPSEAADIEKCKLEAGAEAVQIGGLIGLLDGPCTLQDSAASLPAIAITGEGALPRCIGGLIGQIAAGDGEVSIERCYADTGYRNTNGYAGGLSVDAARAGDRLGAFVGRADRGSMQSCYALGRLLVENAAAGTDAHLCGFGGAGANARFTNCYTAATYGEAMAKDAKVYSFCDQGIKKGEADTRYYLYAHGITEYGYYTPSAPIPASGYPEYLYGQGVSYDWLSGSDKIDEEAHTFLYTLNNDQDTGDWRYAEDGMTNPYGTACTGQYPFPILSAAAENNARPFLPHNGDWPGWEGEKFLVYYEKYGNGNYGYHDASGAVSLQDKDGLLVDLVVPGAAASTKTYILEDGYAILCRTAIGDAAEGPLKVEYSVDDGNGSLRSASLTLGNAAGALTDTNGNAYAVFPFPVTLANGYVNPLLDESRAQTGQDGKRSFYHQYQVGGYRFFCNPCFASSALNRQGFLPQDDYSIAANKAEPFAAYVRTARQLYKLGQAEQSAYWGRSASEMAFTQTCSLDFESYGMEAGYYNRFNASNTRSDRVYLAPIGNGETKFSAAYKGNQKTINAAAIKGDDYVGLFGYCEDAVLSGIYLTNANVEAVLTPSQSGVPAELPSEHAAGLLVGKAVAKYPNASNAGSITDCRVYRSNTSGIGGLLPSVGRGCKLRAYNAYAGENSDSLYLGSVGGLVGSANSYAIRDSFASPTGMLLMGIKYAGGFAGSLNSCNVISCYGNVNLLPTSDTDGTGAQMPGFVSPPAAETGDRGCQFAGGFVGYVASAHIQCSYACGVMENRSRNAYDLAWAGFVARGAGEFVSCYANVGFSGIDTAHAFAAPEPGVHTTLQGTDAGSYTRCFYNRDVWRLVTANPNSSISNVTGQTTAQLNAGVGLATGLSSCFTAATGTGAETYTHPYRNSGNYPCPYLKGDYSMGHYGDWPGGSALPTRLAYCEKYQLAPNRFYYGYYYVDADGAHSTLLDGNTYTDPGGAVLPATLVADGYAFLRDSSDAFTVTYGGATTNSPAVSVTFPGATADDSVTFANVGSYNVYRLGLNAGDVLSSSNTAAVKAIMGFTNSTDYAEKLTIQNAYSFYYRLSLDGFSLYFNPGFAKTSVAASSLPKGPGEDGYAGAVSVRSARQLYNLGAGLRAEGKNSGSKAGDCLYWGYRVTNAANNSASVIPIRYLQERDIDFAAYDYSFYGSSALPDMTPIGRPVKVGNHTVSHPFSGTYNGGYRTISGTDINSGTSEYAGLFGWNAGSLSNIVFRGSVGGSVRQIGNASADYAGGLVGRNAAGGNITNCAADGFDISGGGYTGGFVGYNEANASITRCSAAHFLRIDTLPWVGGQISGGTNYGGFAGGNRGSISYCYAVAHMDTYLSQKRGFIYQDENPGGVDHCYCVSNNTGLSWLSFSNTAHDDATCVAYDGSFSGFISKLEAMGFGAPAVRSYPYSGGGNFPGRAIVRDDGGDYVHYGNWPLLFRATDSGADSDGYVATANSDGAIVNGEG